ncbi:nitroreductase family protein [Candidatus Poribacteria bacterium]|nr:nitroreductase family protein [Candidatus Poribacteria bacterium]
MSKTAASDHPIHDLIAERWSPRAFTERPIPDEVVRSLLEAARWAPSSLNEQPWAFLIGIRGRDDEHERIASCLSEGNRRWAPKAPVLMVAVARLHRARDGHSNRHAHYDTGGAVAGLTLQATASGLYVHQMGGFDRDRVRDLYAVPEDCDPMVAVAVGYLDEPSSLPEDFRDRELAARVRNSLTHFVFEGRWGSTSTLVTPSKGSE